VAVGADDSQHYPQVVEEGDKRGQGDENGSHSHGS
jgi:hypothetical protein